MVHMVDMDLMEVREKVKSRIEKMGEKKNRTGKTKYCSLSSLAVLFPYIVSLWMQRHTRHEQCDSLSLAFCSLLH